MATEQHIIIQGAVEGLVDEAVLQRLIAHVGATVGPIYGKRGKPHLRQRIRGYNQAAWHSPWLVLIDLDQDADCAAQLCPVWLSDPAPMMRFRIAVRAIESWILADRERLARFLSVAPSRLPLNPEEVLSPKRALVELSRYSRRREIRDDMVPSPGSEREVGPGYSSRVIEFVLDAGDGWRPDVAAQYSDSLHRCIVRLRELAGRLG